MAGAARVVGVVPCLPAAEAAIKAWGRRGKLRHSCAPITVRLDRPARRVARLAG
jgi:hypothetical protein